MQVYKQQDVSRSQLWSAYGGSFQIRIAAKRLLICSTGFFRKCLPDAYRSVFDAIFKLRSATRPTQTLPSRQHSIFGKDTAIAKLIRVVRPLSV